MSGKIIAINGRISGGKDTVAKIIQYLVFCKHFGLNAPFEPSPQIDYRAGCSFQVKKFAGKLKVIAGILLGDPNFVQNWEKGGKEYRNEYLPQWGMTRRQFLLDLGTKALRQNFHEDVHVISTFADHTEEQDWMITDLRFPNEFEGSLNRGAITIRVHRHYSKIYPKLWEEFMYYLTIVVGNPTEEEFVKWLYEYKHYELHGILTHPSETLLRHHPFKYEVDNNGTLEELIQQIQEILIAENIL